MTNRSDDKIAVVRNETLLVEKFFIIKRNLMDKQCCGMMDKQVLKCPCSKINFSTYDVLMKICWKNFNI